MARPRLRGRLLTAARALLQEEGASALTTRAVAERAGVTEATLFNNFGDKSGLLRALVVEATPEFGTLMAEIERQADDLQAWAIAVFQAVREYNRVVVPLAGQQLLTGPDPAALRQDPIRFPIHHALTKRLQELQAEGRLPPTMDAESKALLLHGAAMIVVVTERTMGAVPIDENEAELARRIVSALDLTAFAG